MTQEHEGELLIGAIANANAPPSVGVPKLQFVRYPSAQQLTLWLPQHGYYGYGALRVFGPNGAVEETTVRDRLNGSVQILWDTLNWAPGAYRIEITHDDGWRHEIALEKLAEGVKPPPVPAPPAPPPSDTPIVYRDGFGNVLPNADLELRATLNADLAGKFAGPRLEFEGNFRGGTITYVDGDRRIAFWHEMAGGDYKFFIDVPPPETWEARTGAPLAERDAILRFVAEETRRIQAPSWRYEIKDREILFA